jgi:hypothetical protein
VASASEAPWRATDGWLLAGLAGLALVLKLPVLGTPGYWDEMGYLTQAQWLSERELFRVLPGTRPTAAFWGHPPGLHLSAAIPFKLFGPSLTLAHLVIAGFAAIGTAATFLLGRLWHEARTGALAALLLLLSPIYLAQAGLFLADLPVAALGVLCVYLASTKRYVAYLLVASYMVMLKETAMALVAAVALFRLLTSDQPWRVRAADALRHAAPLLVIGTFIVTQKAVTGNAFFIFDFAFEPFAVTSLGQMAAQAWDITRWLFVEQHRWVLTLAVVASCAVHPAARRQRSLLMLGLVVLLSGYAFTVMFFIARYLLPVLPFYFILAAAALTSLAGAGTGRKVLAVAAPAFMVWALLREPPRDVSETNLHYLRSVRLYAAMADTIARRFPNARILTEWPPGNKLESPLLGYVDRPLRVIWFRPGEPLPESDLALVSSPANAQMRALAALATASGWPAVRRLADGPFEILLYETRLPARTPY